MNPRRPRPVAALAVLLAASAASACEAPKTETRRQAVLGLNGSFLPDAKGFKIAAVDPVGPCAELRSADAAAGGSLERGDIVTAIDGRPFADRTEYFALLNQAVKDNKGKAKITVRDVRTGKSVVWIARPELVKMAGPAAPPAAERPTPPAADKPLVPPKGKPADESTIPLIPKDAPPVPRKG